VAERRSYYKLEMEAGKSGRRPERKAE